MLLNEKLFLVESPDVGAVYDEGLMYPEEPFIEFGFQRFERLGGCVGLSVFQQDLCIRAFGLDEQHLLQFQRNGHPVEFNGQVVFERRL